MRGKRKVARGINRRALMAESKQTELCTYLSAILLGGLFLNALFGLKEQEPESGPTPEMAPEPKVR